MANLVVTGTAGTGFRTSRRPNPMQHLWLGVAGLARQPASSVRYWRTPPRAWSETPQPHRRLPNYAPPRLSNQRQKLLDHARPAVVTPRGGLVPALQVLGVCLEIRAWAKEPVVEVDVDVHGL
jgi:hypothetical protein